MLQAEADDRAQAEAAEAAARATRKARRAEAGRPTGEDVATAIADHLAEHPNATKDEVAAAVGCSAKTVQRSTPWKHRHAAARPDSSTPTGLEVVA